MNRSNRLLLMLFVALIPACAVPFTYTFSGIGASGTLGVASFVDSAFTFTAIGDNNPTYICGAFLEAVCNNATTATIAISGRPTATITEAIIVFDNPPQSILGLASLTKMHDIFTVGGSVFDSYNLASSVGPISVNLVQFGPMSDVISTSAGDLAFFGVPGPSPVVTFSAAVPEPSTLLTALAGSALCVLARRKRRHNAADRGMVRFLCVLVLAFPLEAGIVITTSTSAQARFSDGSSYQKNCQTQDLNSSTCAINDLINGVTFIAGGNRSVSGNGTGASVMATTRFFTQSFPPLPPNTPTVPFGQAISNVQADYSDMVVVTGAALGTFTINLLGSVASSSTFGGSGNAGMAGAPCLFSQSCLNLTSSLVFPFQDGIVFPVQFTLIFASAGSFIETGAGDAFASAQITGFTVTGGTVSSLSGNFGTQANLPEPGTLMLTGLTLLGTLRFALYSSGRGRRVKNPARVHKAKMPHGQGGLVPAASRPPGAIAADAFGPLSFVRFWFSIFRHIDFRLFAGIIESGSCVGTAAAACQEPSGPAGREHFRRGLPHKKVAQQKSQPLTLEAGMRRSNEKPEQGRRRH
jgi:PEP-CTERM motif